MIVITGASDGLGLEVAKIYKQAGKKVINVSRRESEFADHNILHDLQNGDEILLAANEILAIDEKIEVLINCAGVWSEEPLGTITEEEIDRVLSTNVKSNMLLTSELLGRIKNDTADVLNVISTAGLKGNAHHALYVSSKWAQRGYSLSLQDELKDSQCRVINFYPGGMKTKLFEKNIGEDITEDDTTWMDPTDLAIFIKQILDLPKSIEVSEITLNRKKNA